MNNRTDVYHLIAKLVNEWPADAEAQSATLEEAQSWLRARDHADIRVLARDTLDALDLLLHALQGGVAMDALLDAREALKKYVNRAPEQSDAPLQVKLMPAGGVTLLRKGQHFTIGDEDLEEVREAVNTRKREIRKHQRRASGSKQ